MEKKGSGSGSRELQCVGRLDIVWPKPAGFLCGSIPVTTDEFHDISSVALVPSLDTVKAPRYQMIPTETDLNALPLPSSIPDRVLPIAAAQSRTSKDPQWSDEPIVSSLMKKGEALAVSGLVEYGDEIDVIAPTDILKQIFKIPYSKGRVSIAVHRVGHTLILNAGPDADEGETLIRRHNRQPKCADQSLFLNFAMHSVRMEACDCPPGHNSSSDENFRSSSYPDQYMSNDGSLQALDHLVHGHTSLESDGIRGKGYVRNQEFKSEEKENLFLGKKKNKRHKDLDDVNEVSEVNEKLRHPVQESEKYRRPGEDAFLRMLFWQFHNFRMLLGSDLLIFSNEKYAAVSLHLWDVSRKVTPLTWLEAWLDNFMASVPELAICYHQDGVVQGYELLKTDDIFLLKGVSDDGTPAFQPHVVQQNGLSVLRFLEENCKQDPGAYWLYKSAGDDVIQLFDLSVLPQTHSGDRCHDTAGSLPSLLFRWRSDSILSLGTLLYRIAHRLSLSVSPDNRARCYSFFKKCLSFLDEPNHLVVRALAHEQFARLLLSYDEDLESISEMFPVESEVTIANSEEESFVFINGWSATSVQNIVNSPVKEVEQHENAHLQNYGIENSIEISSSENIYSSNNPVVSGAGMEDDKQSTVGNTEFVVPDISKTSDDVVETVSDPLSSKLAAIHHVSQAIKSLRWTRQLQIARPELNVENGFEDDLSSSMDFSVCACGDSDCIEVCDIREWLPTSKIDDKLLKLVLLLGESYLALGQAYKDAGQVCEALKVVELACLIYGSMPQDTRFISSMVCSSATHPEIRDRSENMKSFMGDFCLTFDGLSSNYLFWSKAWTLVGDVFVEFYLMKGVETSRQAEREHTTKGLKVSSEVLKEVERLKKKMSQYNQNCSSCSLINCSCRSDRASSGSSASSSTRSRQSSGYGRKQSKISQGRSNPYIRVGKYGDDLQKVDLSKSFKNENLKHHKIDPMNETCRILDGMQEMNLEGSRSEGRTGSAEKDNEGSVQKDCTSETVKGEHAVKCGGIFKYLRGSIFGDVDSTLSVSLNCYEEAEKAMEGLPASSGELQSVVKKKGWVCNELGRTRLERKDLGKAETAFLKAVDAFRQVEDHINIILINCNLGHGRRSLAEDMVSRIESLKKHARFRGAYLQALETAKLQYSEALRYYCAAKSELNTVAEKTDPVSTNLKNEVSTQLAHTYLKLGMLLARENTVSEVYENCVLEDYTSSSSIQTPREHRKHEISANDAIREALSLYESQADLRKQETAYAHFQLACYQRDCCLRFLDSDQINNVAKGENSLVQKAKQYVSLAERNWQKSMDFYGPKTHPVMYLTILIEMSALFSSLSKYLHSTLLLDSALTRLLEGHHVSEEASPSLNDQNPEFCAKFWSHLQMLLKSMLAETRSIKTNKTPAYVQQSPSGKSSDAKKLTELYRMSLKSTDFRQLLTMQKLWTS
ncbi:hypothetical protein F511_05144 [Dorcoceras hygrometricum]|uniref:EDRF1 N-terminal domain-containing protein n=1 Tax=Dorcoceras hygrometricum TaxID=472368 RepID=A0A2Z7C324_9LAMI|nr:hypothetical protein F511_05144 [Dorcoceras hygrometricum]